MPSRLTVGQRLTALWATCLMTAAIAFVLYAFFIALVQVFFWLKLGRWYAAPLREVFFQPVEGLTLSAAPFDPLPHFALAGTAFDNWLREPTQWVGVSKIVNWLLGSSAHFAIFALAILSTALGSYIGDQADRVAKRIQSQPLS